MNFERFMKIMSIIYALVGLGFYFGHSILENILALETAPNLFWLTLTGSMMAMLSCLSWLSSLEPNNPAYVQVHLLSKSMSVLGFIVANFIDQQRIGYFVGAGVDLTILLVVFFSYRMYRGTAQ